MTPQEKAIELVNRFGDAEFKVMQEYIPCYDQLAKQCALIAVDEIIKAFRKDLPEIGLGKGYWAEVKSIIEKL
jgi:hypothetical protein